MTQTEADERLQAQLEYLRSVDHLRELAAIAAEMTPEERLAQAWAMSRSGAAMRERLPEEARARVEAYREPLGPDAEQVLQRLGRLPSPGPNRAPGSL
jgi:hypothetical protein